jgi:asparagine synthase (glutamine-hydrolysing)
MCGIAAIFNYRPSADYVSHEELLAIRDHMSRRGPDGAGEWISPDRRVGLGHRRLSIIDLSPSGAQPMFNEDRSLAIIFNGEIYNYRELRSQLSANGYRFESQSDTEVILKLYDQRGTDVVHALRGMYTFLIWDAPKRMLFAARDPFGIKPLYYADDGKSIRVASQVKALLAGRRVDTSIDPAGHVGFFLWGAVPDPFTLYRGISALPAGHTLTISENGERIVRSFYSVPEILRTAESGKNGEQISPAEKRAILHDVLHDSAEHHLVADVPVGVFLSAGLDSSTITALVSESHRDVQTVTLGFEEYRGSVNDEAPYAELIARNYHTRHETVWVTRDDFAQERDNLFRSMDSPSIDGVNTYFVSLATRRTGLKVALSGLGGDELFGGYPSFRDVPRLVRSMKAFPGVHLLGRPIRVVSSKLIQKFTSPKYAGIFEYSSSYPAAYLMRRSLFMPWELPNLLDPDLVREGWQRLNTLGSLGALCDSLDSARLKVSALELCCYMRQQLLRDSDWAGMAHSLEIRVPFVDIDLLRKLGALLAQPRPFTKQDVVDSLSKKLPQQVLDRPKTGFSVPVREWLMEENSKFQIRNSKSEDRGLRGWAREVYARVTGETDGLDRLAFTVARSRRGSSRITSADAPKLEILMLLTDGFGGFGGIAKNNRDLVSALSSSPDVEKVTVVPRLMPEAPGPLPSKVVQLTDGLGGKRSYISTVLRAARQLRASAANHLRPIVICGHINLVPVALAARRLSGAEVYLIVQGVDSWQPTRSSITNACVKHVNDFISISAVTRRRLLRWSGLHQNRGVLLPCCVDMTAFTAGPKPADLIEQYGLNGERVLFTLGRLASDERYKGFDEVIECLTEIGEVIPNVTYLIGGDGLDRPRLVNKARSLGLRVIDCVNDQVKTATAHSEMSNTNGKKAPRVIFTGRIPEDRKADYLRLADLFVLASSGEGFGIVLLESLACGVPVIGSKLDATREVLREGQLGTLVDPSNHSELIHAIVASLTSDQRNQAEIRHGVAYFSKERFAKRVHALVRAIRSGQTESKTVSADSHPVSSEEDRSALELSAFS